MKRLLPHIDIGKSDGRVVLVIGDSEVAEFIADFLREDCHLACESLTSVRREDKEVVKLYFPPGVSEAQVEEQVLTFSPHEIEGIYKLNHH
jgi:hypothetical protein